LYQLLAGLLTADELHATNALLVSTSKEVRNALARLLIQLLLAVATGATSTWHQKAAKHYLDDDDVIIDENTIPVIDQNEIFVSVVALASTIGTVSERRQILNRSGVIVAWRPKFSWLLYVKSLAIAKN
jgi:hypothetical protein